MSECEQASRLGAYHDGELDAAERTALERHLWGCAACAAELGRIRRLSGLLVGGLPAPAVSARASQRFHATAELASSRGLRHWAEALTAVAAAVLVACNVWLWRPAPAARPADPLPVWEVSALQRPTDPPAISPEDQFALWVVQDLSGGNGHE